MLCKGYNIKNINKMTVIINRQEELEALIDDNNIIIKDDLIINCNIDIEANIEASNIKARNIKAWDIEAFDIKADDIEAFDIRYYSVCIARESLKCKTIEGRRENAVHLCLDKPIEYIKERPTIPSTNIIVKTGI